MWLITMTANNGLEEIGKALETLQMPEAFKKTVVSGDSVYGFVTSYQGTEGLVYNKAMIEEAGMEFTPTEMFLTDYNGACAMMANGEAAMFLNGTWSYDDF